ncbi:MAG TPA: hypothetical protein VJ205_03245, partial [Gammaproteobacteria bacterium]|nr:hypothetical protein [Gammaproteobacteria bacterium]
NLEIQLGTSSKSQDFARVLNEFCRSYSEYVCSDALTFRGCIYPQKKDEILKRTQVYLKSGKGLLNEASVLLGSQPNRLTKQYSALQIKNTAKIIDQLRAGCCTTLALSAANKMMQAYPSEKTEIVVHNRGRGSHCFVIVNRKEGSNLNDITTWGPDVLVVDPWVASLGHGNSVFHYDQLLFPIRNHKVRQGDYPFSGLLSNLSNRFDSKAPPSTAENTAPSGSRSRFR